MPRRKDKPNHESRPDKIFYLDFLTPAQKIAYSVYQQNDICFFSGVAGTGKSFIATAFAIQDILEGKKNQLVLTRPIVEAGENLGYLPGTLHEKVEPYMMPLYDSISKIVGKGGSQREMINACVKVAPLAYMRGSTFEDSVCILDEAQNCTREQIVLFLTRLGNNSKMIITGDPEQSDLFPKGDTPLARMIEDISPINGVGCVDFPEKYIVRHPLVNAIIKRLNELKK